MGKKLDTNYVPWKDLLQRATNAMLFGTKIEVLQIPNADNGYTAVVHARVTFEDGRVFEDVGDANPANTNDTTSNALLRMASTRAKARCLRDALNIGEVADVELPAFGSVTREERNYAPETQEPRAAVSRLNGALVCSNHQCGKQLTDNQAKVSKFAYGQPYCPTCQKLVSRIA